MRTVHAVSSVSVPLLALLSGCGIEYDFTYLHPTTPPCSSAAMCQPIQYDGRDDGTTLARFGYAAQLATWGDSTSATRFVSAVVGAPARGTGSVVIRQAFAGALTSTVQTVTPGGQGFGSALLTASVRDGNSSSRAFGQEILVGAPGPVGSSADGPGAVYWYYADAATPANARWQLGGSIAPPTSLPNDSRFGTALAASRTVGSSPTGAVSWVAVSAPHASRVLLYRVTPSAAAPFTYALSLSPTSGASGHFGAALAAGDFDGDGQSDLAVGDPRGGASGVVYLYRGDAHTGLPGATPSMVSRGVGIDEFGASLAAGRFWGTHFDRHALVVGSPGMDLGAATDAGSLAQYVFTLDGSGLLVPSAQGFVDNPSGAANERFGEAVAVANLLPQDSTGGTSTDVARTEEIAVGVPGYSSSAGEVEVFATGDAGIMTTCGGGALTLYRYGGWSAGARFGASLAAGYAEQPVVSHPTADLLVGAPDYLGSAGHVSLSRGALPAGNIGGTYQGTDSTGASHTLRVDQGGDALTVTFTDGFHAEMVKSDGTFCSVAGHDLDLPLQANSQLNLQWNATTARYEQEVNSSGVTLYVSAYSTGSTLYLALDETRGVLHTFGLSPSCHVIHNPFAFTLVASTVCD